MSFLSCSSIGLRTSLRLTDFPLDPLNVVGMANSLMLVCGKAPVIAGAIPISNSQYRMSPVQNYSQMNSSKKE